MPSTSAVGLQFSLSQMQAKKPHQTVTGAGAIPALKRLLDADIDRHKARLVASARQGRKDAREGGFPFNPFGYWVEWRTVTDLPGTSGWTWKDASAAEWEAAYVAATEKLWKPSKGATDDEAKIELEYMREHVWRLPDDVLAELEAAK